MNYCKVQADLIKAAFENDNEPNKHNLFYAFVSFDGYDFVGVIPNGNQIYYIPKPFYYLNTEKIFNHAKQVTAIKDFINRAEYDLTCAGTLPDGAIMFQRYDGRRIFVDSKLCKNVKLQNCTFKGSQYNEPVIFYEDGIPVMAVLTIHHSGV